MPPKKLKLRRGEGVAFPVGTRAFDPNAQWRSGWDMTCMLLLIVCAFLTPYEIAFLAPQGLPNPDYLWALNSVFTIFFLTDMLFNFNTAYFDYRTSAWVVRKAKISRRYIRGWFAVDFISVIHFEDILWLVNPSTIAGTGGSLRLLRIIRVARLAKLARVFRASRILKRWSKHFSITFGMQTILKAFLMTSVTMHWSACSIRIISDIARDECRQLCFTRNWVKTCSNCHCQDDLDGQKEGIQWETSGGANVLEWYKNDNVKVTAEYSDEDGSLQKGIRPNDCFAGYLNNRNAVDNLYNYTYYRALKVCMRSCKSKNWLDMYGQGWTGNPANLKDPIPQYLAALYWSVTVLKGTDFQSINLAEYTLSILLMLIGGAIYAIIVGDVTNVFGNLDEAGNEFKRVMDNLNTYMDANHFDDGLKIRLRSYFSHCKNLLASQYHRATLQRMSPVLRGEVANHETGGWVVQIPFFRNAPKRELRDIITEIAMVILPEVYVPDDVIVSRGSLNKMLYIVEQGLVVLNVPQVMPQFLYTGAVFGEDIIINALTDKVQQRNWQVTCLTYVNVHTISANKLLVILTNGSFPETYKSIRKTALKLLLRLHFPAFLRKHMNNPDINSMHDLVKLLVGATAEVDVAIEQRVEEDAIIQAGFKAEELSKINRTFDQYSRWQKDLEKNIGILETECQTIQKLFSSILKMSLNYLPPRGLV